MESLDSTTFVYLTFISGDGGKIRVQFREDCIVAERNECYRDESDDGVQGGPSGCTLPFVDIKTKVRHSTTPSFY